ncbi:MAG: hypothetical protein KJ709_04505 [Nanoarchaeota archaeon]|nr:hypothetical protein [Nanoarchaeota archaeon]
MRPHNLTQRSLIYPISQGYFITLYNGMMGYDRKSSMIMLAAPSAEHDWLQRYAYVARVTGSRESRDMIDTAVKKNPEGVVITLESLEEEYFIPKKELKEHKDKVFKDERKLMPYVGEVMVVMPEEAKEQLTYFLDEDAKLLKELEEEEEDEDGTMAEAFMRWALPLRAYILRGHELRAHGRMLPDQMLEHIQRLEAMR